VVPYLIAMNVIEVASPGISIADVIRSHDV
jgi:hypothetical protein